MSVPPTILNVRSSPSISLPDNKIESDSSSLNNTSETVVNTGASFIALIVIFTSASSDKSPSLTLNVKLSEPLKSAFGV